MGRFEPGHIPDPDLGEEEKEEAEGKDQVNVALGPEDRARVDALKELWDIKSDSKAIKLGLEIGKNAIFALFSAKTAGRLSDRARVRLSDYDRDGRRK